MKKFLELLSPLFQKRGKGRLLIFPLLLLVFAIGCSGTGTKIAIDSPKQGDVLFATAGQTQDAGLIANAQYTHTATVKHVYQFWCYDKDGNLKWYDEIHNLIPTVGLNEYLDAMWKAGASANWYVGLVTGPGSGTTYAAGDTMASHGGWTEDVTYSNATRPALTMGTVSGGSVDNSASKAQYSINGSATIAGAFVVTDSTKSGTSGILGGCGDFTGGDRTVQSGDTLNVQITASITSS